MIDFEYYYFGEVEILTLMQDELVKLAVENVNQIVDLEKLKTWCIKENVKELFIFGSRANLSSRENSDLDIMISSYEIKNINNNNYIELQREAISKLYTSFGQCIIDKSIELDFKLNTSQDECYYGITYGDNISDDGECDFYFEYENIPSFILINEENINFAFAESLDLVFDKERFIKQMN